MKRRAFLAGSVALLAAPLAVEGQPTTKPARIGWLVSGSPQATMPGVDAFRYGLKVLGCAEGQHYSIEAWYAGDRTERLPALGAELAALSVDVIVTPGTPAALAAQQATRNIPIVMLTVADPVGSGLVRSFSRPEGNVTGTALALDEVSHKWLELLRSLRPRLSRVGVIQNSTNRSMPAMLKPLEVSARTLGLTLSLHDVSRPDALTPAFNAVVQSRAEALVVLPDAFLQDQRGRVLEHVARVRLPAIYANRREVTAGGLISYGPDFLDHYRRAAG